MTWFERANIHSRRELTLQELRRSQSECDRQALVRPINWQSDAASDALGERTGPSPRLVKTQCSCSSGFSSDLRPWIGSSLKYDCSLVTRGRVRFFIQSFKKITTWTWSSALIGPEGTLLVFLFQAPFTKIDMHRSGIRPALTGTDEMHTTQREDIRNCNCGNALRALCGSLSCALHPCARTVDS